MGYVKNHAKNGNHYWVFAVIVPIVGGLLSVRIKPSTELLAAVEQIYQRLLTREVEVLATGAAPAEAMEQATTLLADEIRQAGFPSYEAFSHHGLNMEIKHRDQAIERCGLRLFPEDLGQLENSGAVGTMVRLKEFYRQTRETYGRLNALFATLDAFIAMGEGIRQHKETVQHIAEDFRLNALNAHIASDPLGAEGITIGTITQFLTGHAQTLAGSVTAFAEKITDTTEAVTCIASSLATARLQLEMFLSFLAEIASGQKPAEAAKTLLAMAKDLWRAFLSTLEKAVAAIADLQGHIPRVLTDKEQVRQEVIYLHAAQISGLTEAVRIKEADYLRSMFAGLREQISSAKHELEQLGEVVDELTLLTNSTPPKIQDIYRSLDGGRAEWGEAETAGA